MNSDLGNKKLVPNRDSSVFIINLEQIIVHITVKASLVDNVVNNRLNIQKQVFDKNFNDFPLISSTSCTIAVFDYAMDI